MSIAFENVLILFFLELLFIFNKKGIIGIFPLAISVIFFYINVSAPGTAIRRTYFVGQPMIKSLLMTAQRAYYDITIFFTVHVLILLIILSPIIVEIISTIKIQIYLRHVCICAVVSLFIWCGVIAMPFYSMSNWGPGRYNNLVWANFICFLIVNYSILLGYLYNNECIRKVFVNMKEKSNVYYIIIGMLLVFVLPNREGFDFSNGYVKEEGYSNGIKAIIEINNGTAHKYAEQMDERIRLYNDESVDEVIVDFLKSKPQLLFFSDLSSDTKVFPNTSIVQYYKKKSVIAK